MIDWVRLSFSSRDEVDRYLRLCQLDPVADDKWLRGVLHDAVAYLRDTFHHQIPDAVAQPREIHDLFLYASSARDPQLRKMACMTLKVCHVIMHIEARDLFHRLPLSEESFGEMASARVMDVLVGLNVVSSAKSRASVISKLLQKADTLAAKIYDRTRFRIEVPERSDVLPTLQRLTEELFPFHLVVPGQTQNTLIDFRHACETTPAWAPLLDQLQYGIDFLDDGGSKASEFSGASYQMLKFVIDLPLRIDDALISADIAAATRARTVCCLVEIQIVDAATARANEQGDNEHKKYKERQRLLVQHRLSRGLAASFTRKS